MVKMNFDTSDVDLSTRTTFAPYEGDVPRPGTYNAEIRSVRLVESKAGNTYFKVLYVLGHDEAAKKDAVFGCPIFDNVVPGNHEVQKERLAAFLKAVCGKQKAVVDADDLDDGGKVNKIGGKEPVGVKVRLVVVRDTYNGEPQAKVADVVPWPKGGKWLTEGPGEPEAEEDAEDAAEPIVDDEEDAAEEEAEETADDEEEAEDDDEEEEEDDEEEDDGGYEARVAELADLDRAALKAALKEADSEFKVLKKHSDDDLRAAILAAEFEADEEGEEGEDEPPF